MANYLCAEFYKVFRRRYFYGILGIVWFCELAILFACWITRDHQNDFDGADVILSLVSIGIYLAVLVGHMVCSDQQSPSPLKNELAYGIPRSQIYLGKLLTEEVTGILLSVLVVTFFEIVSFLMFPASMEEISVCLDAVIYGVLAALPLWLGAAALTHLCLFLSNNQLVGLLVTAGLLYTSDTVTFLLGRVKLIGMEWFPWLFANINARLFFGLCSQIKYRIGDLNYLQMCWFWGMVWVAVCTVLGLLLFQRREIK